MHRIAFYDLDRTITRLPTWSAFLLFGALRLAPWRLALTPLVLVALVALRRRPDRRDRLKERMHCIFLGRRVAAERMDALAMAFADRVVGGYLRPGAACSIARDRSDGYRPVLATAAHLFYAGHIARRLGIVDVIATQAERDRGGAVLAAISGGNLYGPAKLAAIEAWLKEAGIVRDTAHLRFYSDHVSDLPCLEFADEAFAVNPHARLRRVAADRHWPVLDWQDGDAGSEGAS